VIRIERGPVPPTVRVFGVANVKAADGSMVTRAQRESREAIAFFTNPANYANNKKLTPKQFAFRIYKNSQLAQELERIFGTKCAYCESDFGHVTPKDVEHFRPKSEIDTGAGELVPGYYWLAGEWDNLLVSCPDCNRGRNFQVPGQPALIRLGKATQFPLENEAARFRGPGPGIGGEEPLRLLIDPCVEEPADHLTFNDQAFILPRVGAAGPSKKGEVSISVYALQRSNLVKARLVVLNDFVFQVGQLRKAIRNVNGLTTLGITGPLMDENLDNVRLLKAKLKSMLAPSAVYLGMLRDWIRTQKQAGSFADLEQFGIDLELLI
jgi:uncharacterized protein (TIGR02646 family)